MLYYKEISTS